MTSTTAQNGGAERKSLTDQRRTGDVKKPEPEVWKPAGPGFEINQYDRRRTVGHKPQVAQRPIKKPEPVTQGTYADWMEGYYL